MALTLLQKAAKLLNKTFHTQEFLDNALAVSFNQADPPFALVIIEEDNPDVLYYSVAVDAPDPHSVADIALRLINMAKTELSEPFYLNDEGELFWSDEAYAEYMSGKPDAGGNQAFLDLESPSKLVN